VQGSIENGGAKHGLGIYRNMWNKYRGLITIDGVGKDLIILRK